MLNYQDYISQFVEIEGMHKCIKNIEIGAKILQTNSNSIISNSILEIGTISHNLYNSSYLINMLSSRTKCICKIKKKGKIYFLNNSHGTFAKPPITTATSNDFAILDNYGNTIFCELYNHNTDTELIIQVDPFMLCIFKFNDFSYTSEIDYIYKKLI